MGEFTTAARRPPFVIPDNITIIGACSRKRDFTTTAVVAYGVLMFTNGEPGSWVRGYIGEREVETEGSRMRRRRLIDSPAFHAVWPWVFGFLWVFIVVTMAALVRR